MTRIFLVRHGEAEGNLYRRAQGQTDVELTPRGREQVALLAKRFENETIHAAYSSDLTRAYRTAVGVAEGHGLTVTKEPRLREMHLGSWENRPWGDLTWEEPEQMRLFGADPANWSSPGHEDFYALQQRMKAALTDIAAAHPDQTVLCASHGMAIRCLLALLLGIPSAEFVKLPHGDNTAVALLTVEDGQFHVEYYNDNSHLPQKLSPFAGQRWWKERSGTDNSSLRYETYDLETGRERFLACYRDAWQIAHGDLTGFDEEACWRGACIRAADSPEALLAAYRGETFAGIIALDERRGRSSGMGWISFCYITPESRGLRCGIQLIGCAVARYRALGRTRLCLTVAPSNPARGFYEKAGFVVTGTDAGAVEPLLIMEKPL